MLLAKEKIDVKSRIRLAITLAGVVLCALPNRAMGQSSPKSETIAKEGGI